MSLSKDSIGAYLTEIGRTPRLTHEEELLLGRAIQQHMQLEDIRASLAESLEHEPSQAEWADAAQLSVEALEQTIKAGQRAREKMVKANLRLVVSIAKKYQKSQLEFMDLIQEGAIGLQRGAEKFDPGKGYRFSTYAYWWIRQAMTRAIAEKSRIIRLPINVNEKITKLRRAQRQLAKTHKRPATIAELSEVLSMPKEKVRNLLLQSRDPLSLDLRMGEKQDTSLSDMLEDDGPTPQEYVVESSLKEDLRGLMTHLSGAQQQVLTLRYGLNSGVKMSFAKIGDQMGISRQRVRQIEREALKRMRYHQTDVSAYLAVS
ncbi:RNA polymerase sigma factor, RpoD/SigA family [Leptolyngbya cf. ectocarpi LEGE 11479]|uniref:RNA polymerase sigma factor, RpoD/SigA family n=2 Tax=Leptolyngbya ectocarpi TaxID=1202 RepID=A0A928ZV06_LEPEC|nr:RNA polymerase sigma factor, RpoD/SigA family [Leptolyngbya cf. ectocarpi LEGE 11479]